MSPVRIISRALLSPDEGWHQSRVDDCRHADLDLGQVERRSRGYNAKVHPRASSNAAPRQYPLTAEAYAGACLTDHPRTEAGGRCCHEPGKPGGLSNRHNLGQYCPQ